MKITNLLILVVSFISLVGTKSANASDFVGFNRDNSFQALVISGPIMVTCNDYNGASETRYYTCNMDILDPGEFAKFYGPKNSEADNVVLLGTREDGSQREKSEKYDGEKGISKDSINLWITTLFQRPLLKMGKNNIQYKLYKSSRAVGQGQFEVQVFRGKDRQCSRQGYYNSNDMNDCRNSFNVCRRYFSENNFCN
jgi:hypothetical protein